MLVFMSLLVYLASAFGIAMGLATLPQAIKIFRRKSAKDIAPLTYMLFVVGGIVWIAYGIELGNTTIIVSYSPGIICSIIVLIGWLKYR